MRRSGYRLSGTILMVLLTLVALFSAWVYWASQRGDDDEVKDAPKLISKAELGDPKLIERGAYLAKAGNCAGCHTAPGQAEFGGGRGLETPFGTVYASNLTPDEKTGLGTWTAEDFWRAMHHGQSKDGRLLNPVFPYSSYTLVERQDSDALFAFLRSLPAVSQQNHGQELHFPYNTQVALRVWRALYFQPRKFKARSEKSADWNRGAYLVQGLGHCGDCHSPRSSLGGVQSDPEHDATLSGGVMPVQKWYAPSLRDAREAGLQGMTMSESVALLKHGVSTQASVIGPMAEVVFRSTQYLSETDVAAMTNYLQDLPGRPNGANAQNSKQGKTQSLDAVRDEQGKKLYTTHCADCHGDQGQGAEAAGLPAYPHLAGNRAVTLSLPLNLVRILVQGGFPPATPGNPKPFGMPPFSHILSDSEIAQVLTYIRQSWGNSAGTVYSLDVVRSRL
jgi:mono/diheme cytochrome c family protein